MRFARSFGGSASRYAIQSANVVSVRAIRYGPVRTGWSGTALKNSRIVSSSPLPKRNCPAGMKAKPGGTWVGNGSRSDTSVASPRPTESG